MQGRSTGLIGAANGGMLGFTALSETSLSSFTGDEGGEPEFTTKLLSNRTFATRATDDLPNAQIHGRISRGLTIDRAVSTGQEGMFSGLVASRFGDVTFANPEGGLDELLDVASKFADGREVRVRLGRSRRVGLREVVDPYDEFALVCRAIAGSWEVGRDQATLRLRDPGLTLQGPCHKGIFAGTGGREGEEELTDKGRPTAIGRVYNAEPQLLMFGHQIYQIHGGPVQAIDAVFDKGAPIPFFRNVPTFGELAALDVPLGHYATCRAEGLIKLTTIPQGALTVHLRGDRDGISGYVENAGAVLYKLLVDYAGVPLEDVATTSFFDFDVAHPRAVGVFIRTGEGRSIESVIEWVASSAGVAVGADVSGRYRLFHLDLDAAPVIELTGKHLVSIERERLPYSVPWHEHEIGWRRAWTQQSASDLVPGAPAEQRLFAEQEYRSAHARNSHVLGAHRTSRPASFFGSALVDRDHAEKEANRRGLFYSIGRTMFRYRIKHAPFLLDIGKTFTLTIPRFGLDNGQTFVVVGVTEDLGEMSTEIRCFG